MSPVDPEAPVGCDPLCKVAAVAPSPHAIAKIANRTPNALAHRTDFVFPAIIATLPPVVLSEIRGPNPSSDACYDFPERFRTLWRHGRPVALEIAPIAIVATLKIREAERFESSDIVSE